MTLKRANGAILVVAISILATCGIASSQEPQQRPALFSEIVVAQQFDDTDDPTVIRKRVVKVNFDLLTRSPNPSELAADTAEVLTLNLFDDVELTAVLDRIETTIPEFFSWIGHIEEVADSKVVLIVGEGLVQGSITMPDALYKISSVGNGRHAIFEIDQTGFPPELDPIPVAPEKTDPDPEKKRVAFDAISADDGSAIDVMVFFTTAARIAAGGKEQITAQILEAYQGTNEGYRISGVAHSLRLIDPYAYDPEVDYSESNFDWSATITRLRNAGDKQMDRVHELRDQYKADVVVLFVEGDDLYCGMSYSMETLDNSFESFAFSVISRKCASINHSFAHELGHVMGSQHDHANAEIDGVFDYSHGYQAPDRSFRTIMAYQCPGGCPRINQWSNPEIAYDGQPTGIGYTDSVAAADNRRSLNRTRFTVANFRLSALQVQTGSLTVIITPADALRAGARWRIVGTTTWRNSGATITGIAVGSHAVEFKPTDTVGWTTPQNMTVTINDRQTTSISTAYVRQFGSLAVTITPAAAVTAGARWRIAGTTTWRSSGATENGLAVGEATVEFKPVDDWVTPAARVVTVSSGQTASINAAYTEQPATGGTPPGGDNNTDDGGESPGNQQNNVVEFSTYDNRHQVLLTSPTGTTIRDYRALENPDSDRSPERIDFPYGFFEFAVDGVEPGGTTTVTVELPEDASQDTYYKYGPTADNPSNHWYEFLYDDRTRTGAKINGNRITLHFVDGQRGDDDLEANGSVTDIGGPGVTIVNPSGGASNPPQSADSSAGGGGCFIGLLRMI